MGRYRHHGCSSGRRDRPCGIAGLWPPFGTPLNENTGELNPHHRKFMENADAPTVPATKKSEPITASRLHIASSRVFVQKASSGCVKVGPCVRSAAAAGDHDR